MILDRPPTGLQIRSSKEIHRLGPPEIPTRRLLLARHLSERRTVPKLVG